MLATSRVEAEEEAEEEEEEEERERGCSFAAKLGVLGHRVILHSIDPIFPTERQPQALLRAT